MTTGLVAADRSVIALDGPDARHFLQGLVTSDVDALAEDAPLYTALLSPQGKYLFDFFCFARDGAILIDVAADRAAALLQRLGLYKLRAAVTLTARPDLAVVLGTGTPPDGSACDPRHRDFGWRAITADPDSLLAGIGPLDPTEITRRRIAFAVPESGFELQPDESYILEMGFERLNGVDFRKGCYVGQEVTARMKHKTTLRKGLARVGVAGEAPPAGTPILSGEKEVGTLWSVFGGRGLAYLRFDRAQGEMAAGAATVTLLEEPS
jgi:folate-binding protein YgfZ